MDADGRTGHFSPDALRFFTPSDPWSTTVCVCELGIYLEREKTRRIYKKKTIADVVIVLREKRGGAIEKKTTKKNADEQMFLSLTSLIHGNAQLEKVKQLFSVISNLT